MLEGIQNVANFTSGQTFDEFNKDEKTKFAVLRVLAVLGEAANRLPKELKEQYPEVEWGRIIRSRNVIIYDYEVIDYNVIWRIASVHLPILKISLEKIFTRLDS